MGYCVQMDISVFIPKDKEESCLKAVNAIDNSNYSTLSDALEDWCFGVEETRDNKGTCITHFEGEKWRDQDILFAAIGPYAEGNIRCVGEDGEVWGYRFDGKLIEQQVVWVDN